jgi:peptidoglycan hydrolase CwlO-like protein
MQTLDLIVILGALLCIYGIWRAAKAEQSDYQKTRDAILDVSADVSAATKRQITTDAELSILSAKVKEQERAIEEMGREVDQAQEHIAKLRESYMRLRARIVPKKVQHTHTGAIPVEIHLPEKQSHPLPAQDPKEQMRRIKKQIDRLSK